MTSPPPVLTHPYAHSSFELHTDAPGSGLGAILYRAQNSQQIVTAYPSSGFSKPERNYSSFSFSS